MPTPDIDITQPPPPSEREQSSRPRVTESQLGELVARVSASRQLHDMLDHRFQGVEARLQAGDDRMFRLEEAILANTCLTKRTADDTREMRELMEMGRALFKFAAGFGRFVRWLGGLAAAGAAIWALIVHDKPPGH